MDGKEFVTEALMEIRVATVFNPPTQIQIETGFKRLRRMLSMWRDEGINIGGIDPQDDGQPLGVIQSAEDPVIKNLAVLLAPLYDKVANPELRTAASTGYDFLYQHHNDHTVPDKLLSSQLTRGEGNQTPYGRRSEYFNDTDRIGQSSAEKSIDAL